MQQIIANILAYTFVVAAFVGLWLPYWLTIFDYILDTSAGTLVIVMRWSGFLRIRKRILLATILSVSRARGIDFVPLATGRLPRLWGRPFERHAVIMRFSGVRRYFPVLVTPQSVDACILAVTSARNLGKAT